MTDFAYAMGGSGGGGGIGGGGDISFIIMMAVVFAIFYFLMIRPQQQKQKEIKKMREELGHGDMVVTVGGIHGKVTGITDAIAFTPARISVPPPIPILAILFFISLPSVNS